MPRPARYDNDQFVAAAAKIAASKAGAAPAPVAQDVRPSLSGRFIGRILPVHPEADQPGL